MTVIVLVQKQMPVGSEVEQSLYGLKVLDFGVVELVAQLPILQSTSTANVDSQNCTEDPHVPKREPVANESGPEPHYFSSDLRSTNPKPRTVCRSFAGKGSSSFFRIRAM